jgi:hypothetical protein
MDPDSNRSQNALPTLRHGRKRWGEAGVGHTTARSTNWPTNVGGAEAKIFLWCSVEQSIMIDVFLHLCNCLEVHGPYMYDKNSAKIYAYSLREVVLAPNQSGST